MTRAPHVKVLARMVKDGADFLLIGVFGINHYAPMRSTEYLTKDCDVLLRPEPSHLKMAIRALISEGYSLWAGEEPLPEPDSLILKRLVEHKVVIRARRDDAMDMDIVLEAGGMPFSRWRQGRRMFKVQGVPIPVAGLSQMIESKERAGRKKDKVFLALYKAQLKEME